MERHRLSVPLALLRSFLPLTSRCHADMYSRWQPGLLFALSFIVFVATLCQLLVHHLTYRSELARITRFRKAARSAAYGKSASPSTPSAGQTERKKVKVPLEAARVDADSDDEDVEKPAGNSRAARRQNPQMNKLGTVTMIVQGEQVWIQTEDGHGASPPLLELAIAYAQTVGGPAELPLDASAAKKPSLLNTFVPNLLGRLFSRVLPSRASSTPAVESEVAEAVEGNGTANGIGKTAASGSGSARATPTGSSAAKRRKAGKGKK